MTKTTLLLTPVDLTAMEKIAIKKAEIKKLETVHQLSEKKKNTFLKYEKQADDSDAVLVQIGTKYVRIKRTIKNSVKWAELCASLVSDAEILKAKPNYNKPSTEYKAEEKGREAVAGTLTKIPKVA